MTVSPETIQLWGGALCLDFVNSVDYDARDRPLPATEALHEPRDLARWARRLGVTRGRRLLRVDAAELAATLALRAQLHAALAAIARGERPAAVVLDGCVRQPREDAPDVRAPARSRAGRSAGGPALGRRRRDEPSSRR